MKIKDYEVYLKKIKKNKIKRVEKLGNIIVDLQEERDTLRTEIEKLEKKIKNHPDNRLWLK